MCDVRSKVTKTNENMISKIITRGLFQALFLFNILGSVMYGQSIEFFVATNGSDTNPGTITSPFATIEKARDVIRKSKEKSQSINFVVYLRKGTYHRNSGFILKDIDSGISGYPIVYRPYRDEEVIFSGGVSLNGKDFKLCKNKKVLERIPQETHGNIWMYDLNKHSIHDLGELEQHGFGITPAPTPMEIFVNGQPQQLARYPNQGILKIGMVYDKGSIPRHGDTSNRGALFGYEYDRPNRWLSASDIWLHGKFSFGYNDDHLLIENIDTLKRTFKLKQPHVYGVVSSIYIDSTVWTDFAGLSVRGYYAYNILEEIDKEGEYYIDRNTGKLYIFPNTVLRNSKIEVSMLKEPFIEFNNASHIIIEGIKFSTARGMGVYLANSNNIVINACEFSNLGTVGISMGQAMDQHISQFAKNGSFAVGDNSQQDCSNILISNCLIHNTGTGGVVINGGDRKALIAGNNQIVNCELHHNDRINNTYSPNIMLHGVGHTIRNCYIHDQKHQAIGFSGNDHIIEYSIIERVCLDADDMGAIYTGRNPSARGTTIRYNYFTNITPKNPNTSICGIYIDDGSGGINIFSNIFDNVGNPGHFQNFAAIFFHGGHDNKVYYNVFSKCLATVGNTPWDEERWKKSLEGPLFNKRVLTEVDITDSVYLAKYPELNDYFTDYGPRLNYVKGNVLIESQLALSGKFLLKNNIVLDGKGLQILDFLETESNSILEIIKDFEIFPFKAPGLKEDEFLKWQ